MIQNKDIFHIRYKLYELIIISDNLKQQQDDKNMLYHGIYNRRSSMFQS